MESGEEFFRRINTAVIQDIEDYIIRKGIGEKVKHYDKSNKFQPLLKFY